MVADDVVDNDRGECGGVFGIDGRIDDMCAHAPGGLVVGEGFEWVEVVVDEGRQRRIDNRQSVVAIDEGAPVSRDMLDCRYDTVLSKASHGGTG